jgi:hypothetical protein
MPDKRLRQNKFPEIRRLFLFQRTIKPGPAPSPDAHIIRPAG